MCIYTSKHILNSYVFLFTGGDFIMKKIKNFLNHIFIDGLSGMALGLFSTLIIGTILQQIGNFIPNHIGNIV